MKYSIHVTQAAERDMANAYDYIDLVLKNPTAVHVHIFIADFEKRSKKNIIGT